MTCANALKGVVVSLATTGSQSAGGVGKDKLSSFENLTGSEFFDKLSGSDAANTIMARAGNDVIVGGLGADLLFGGDGKDTFILEGR